MPVPYNGSVARLSFGFLSVSRVRRWLHQGGFDVLHVHEPGIPSLSLLACGVDPDMIREYFLEDCDDVENRWFQRITWRLSRLATTDRRLS